jgi:hypothetical protein
MKFIVEAGHAIRQGMPCLYDSAKIPLSLSDISLYKGKIVSHSARLLSAD